MTDLTKTFRALIKAKQVSNETSLRLNKSAKKPEHISTRFLSQARLILSEIIKLKTQLIECRTDYLSPPYLLYTKNRIMTDQQRIDFEEQIEKQIKHCREELEKLKTSIGKTSYSGQRRTHYSLVCAYLERDLVQCTKIYSEQKCLRYKRESERKKLGRLDQEEQQMLLKINATRSRRITTEIIEQTTTTSTPVPISTITQSFDEGNDETSSTAMFQPVNQELRQLQHENDQLYQEVAQRSEEIFAIAQQVVNISQLQNEIFNNIFTQNDSIENIDSAASASNDDIAAANVNLRNAIRNSAQMRRWVIFFLIVMTFSLLFLDWYNV